MTIPPVLKIGGHLITVKLTKLEGANGESDWTRNEIRIDSELPASQQMATLIHEVFHFLNTTMDEHAFGHALLDSLSEQFYAFLVDNNFIPR